MVACNKSKTGRERGDHRSILKLNRGLLGELAFTSKVNTRDLDRDANVVAASRLRQLTPVVQILSRRQSFHNCRRAKFATVLPSRQSEATRQRRCTSRGKDNFTRPTKNDSLPSSQGIGRRFRRCFVGFRQPPVESHYRVRFRCIRSTVRCPQIPRQAVTF